LLATARKQKLGIIHVQSVFKPDRSDWMLFYRPEGRGQIPCIAGSSGVAIEPFAAPEADEPVITTQTFDSFLNTDLESLLRSRVVKALLLAGLDTSVCVLFTATSAYQRRFVPLVLNDACADEPEKHDTTLRTYNGLCFKLLTTKQVEDD